MLQNQSIIELENYKKHSSELRKSDQTLEIEKWFENFRLIASEYDEYISKVKDGMNNEVNEIKSILQNDLNDFDALLDNLKNLMEWFKESDEKFLRSATPFDQTKIRAQIVKQRELDNLFWQSLQGLVNEEKKNWKSVWI